MKRWVVVALMAGMLSIAGCYQFLVPPIADFSACPDGWRGQADVQFASTSTTVPNHMIVLYRWDFGDGEQTDDYGGWVSHHYAEEGIYTVRLTVTDDRGMEASTEHEIDVIIPAVIESVTLDAYPARATGIVANPSPYALDSVGVQVRFYDADGVRVGEGTADIYGVDPGERVRFNVEAPPSREPIASVRATISYYTTPCTGAFPPPIPMDGGS
jgi:hypothetical protein